MVKKTEEETRQQYTRTIYAATICIQINFTALKTLEGTLNLLHAVHAVSNKGNRKDGTDGTTDEGISDGKYRIGVEISWLVEVVRNLQLDLDHLDRTVQVLEEVSVLNEAVSVTTTECNAFEEGSERIAMKLKQLEAVATSHAVRSNYLHDDGEL